MHPTKQKLLAIYKKEPTTLDEVARCVIKLENKKKGSRLTGLAWNIDWNENVSNSHNCPLTGVTNWSRLHDSKNYPNGYPGWYGRIWLKYYKKGRSFESMCNNLVHTGTGGYDGYSGPWENGPEKYCLSYDFKIFIDDWPLLIDAIEKEKVLCKLKGTKYTGNHYFLWDADK